MARLPKSPGNVDGDAHRQGEQIECRKWERRDIRKLALPTQSIVTLKHPRHQTLRQHHGYWGLDDRKEPSDNPPIKERSAYETYQCSGSEGDIRAAGAKK